MKIDSNVAISIIVPVYNAESTLNVCVDSILCQTYRNFELLLIDDGSKDKSSIICDDYAKQDSRIRVFHKENGGVSSARNLGIDNARGEWVTFIDSDDYIEPNFLSSYEGSAELLITGKKEFFKTKETMKVVIDNPCNCKMSGEELRTFIRRYIDSIFFRSPCAKFFKLSTINTLRFQEDMIVGEDACFVMNYLSRINSIFFVSSGKYVVRLSLLSDDVKYALSTSSAVLSLEHLKVAYTKVDQKFHIGHYGFYSYIGSFKAMSKSDWVNCPSKWYDNYTVKKMYKYVYPSLSCIQKIKLLAARILKKR